MCRSVIRQRKLAWFVPLVAMMGMLPTTPAAPVPTHLMPPEPPLFPTRVGTKWVYAGADGESIHVITRVEKKGDGEHITVETACEGEEREGLWSVRPDGLYLVDGSAFFAGRDRVHGDCWCLMPASRKLGKWEINGMREGGGGGNGALKVAAIEEVEVPAGTFHATKVHWKQWALDGWQSAVKTYWYARGVGVVQVGDPPVWRLKSFELGK